MSRDLQIEIEEFLLSHNINQITFFHNELKRLISNELQIVKGKRSSTFDEERELTEIKDFYAEQLHPKLINNTFLMLFAFLEEMLCIILKSFAKIDSTSSKTGLSKYKHLYKETYNIKLTDFPGWSFLQDASDLRNALLHANGNISFLKKPQKTRDIIAKYPTKITTPKNVIFIGEDFLSDFLSKLYEVKDWLLDKV